MRKRCLRGRLVDAHRDEEAAVLLGRDRAIVVDVDQVDELNAGSTITSRNRC